MVFYKKTISLLLIVVMILLGVLVVSIKQPIKHDFIKAILGNQVLQLEIASDSLAWFNGLSHRSGLCETCGMLFIFPQAENKTFVMRQMNFPLDIIWLNNQIVIGYEENLQPEKQEPYTQYRSPGLVDMVLEVPAGFVKTYQITQGDKLSYEGSF